VHILVVHGDSKDIPLYLAPHQLLVTALLLLDESVGLRLSEMELPVDPIIL